MRQSQRRQKNFTQPCHGAETPRRFEIQFLPQRDTLFHVKEAPELHPPTLAGNPQDRTKTNQFWFFCFLVFPSLPVIPRQAHVEALACTSSHCDRWLMELETMTSSIPSLVSLKDSISLSYHHPRRQPQHKAIISRHLVLREENHPTTTLTTKKT